MNLGEEKETEVKLKQMLALDSCFFNTDSIDFIDALSMGYTTTMGNIIS